MIVVYDYLNKAGLETLLGLIKGKITGNTSNPNLLINPDFKINQRGKTEYTGGWHYTVDRWFSYGTVSVLDNGINMPIDTVMIQMLEPAMDSFLTGKTVTFSICIDSVVYAKTFVYGIDEFAVVFGDIRFEYPARGYYPRDSIAISNHIGGIHNIQWVKLEIGSAATPFIPPDSAAELLKCQRYFQKWDNFVAVPFYPNALTAPPFRTKMRKIPDYNITVTSTSQASITVDNVVLDSDHILCINIPSDIIASNPSLGYYVSGEFDAEIY